MLMPSKVQLNQPCYHRYSALPLPACGERVGVRGSLILDSSDPLTRLALLADLSPQAGRGNGAWRTCYAETWWRASQSSRSLSRSTLPRSLLGREGTMRACFGVLAGGRNFPQ